MFCCRTFSSKFKRFVLSSAGLEKRLACFDFLEPWTAARRALRPPSKQTLSSAEEKHIIYMGGLVQVLTKVQHLTLLLKLLPCTTDAIVFALWALLNTSCNVKGATSRMAHLEKVGQFFQVRLSQSVLILAILNHPGSCLVYYHLFGVFLP